MKIHPEDKVVEPDRIQAIDSEIGAEYPFWESGDPVAMGDLPLGKYFYHYTPEDKIASIRKEGLRSSSEGRHAQYGEPVPNKAECRLYVWPQEKDCLGINTTRNEARSGRGQQAVVREVALRFPRRLFEGKPMWFDARYGRNVWSIYTLDVTVPSTDLEKCVSMRFKRGRYVGEWQPLV